MCVRASQKAFFHRRTVVHQSRAGGVSPPWVRYRDCTGVCEHTAGSLPDSPEAFLQLRLPSPGGFVIVRGRTNRRNTSVTVQTPRHMGIKSEGVSPPWLAIARGETNRRKTSLTVQTPPHIRTGAAGVSQPWFECRTCAGNVITPHYASLVPHRSPGVGHARETQSPSDRRSPLQTRFPKPRRADARRSW